MSGKVLVVDDETELLEFVKMRLEANKYTVLTASNGKEGFDAAVKEQPSLILLDVMMPGMDGFQVLRRLKNQPETQAIPVVMLTAKEETNSIMEARRLRAADYIIKPFESEDLLKTVQRTIRHD